MSHPKENKCKTCGRVKGEHFTSFCREFELVSTKPSEEWEKEFDRLFVRGDLMIDPSPSDEVPFKELKSFIRTLRDQSFKDGYHKGIEDESVNCKEHCDKAVKEERTKVFHQVNNFLGNKYDGIPRIHEFHERCILNLLSSDYDGTDATDAQKQVINKTHSHGEK